QAELPLSGKAQNRTSSSNSNSNSNSRLSNKRLRLSNRKLRPRRAHRKRSSRSSPAQDAGSKKPKWWNWQTHHLEGVAPRGVRVRVPPSAFIESLQNQYFLRARGSIACDRLSCSN